MRIPKLTSIINRALDERGDAVHAHDESTVRQIDTLIKNLYRGMKMRWADDGALIVTSANTAGRAYRVTQHTCDCPAFKPCNHMRLFDLLVDMFATESVTADNEVGPPFDDPLPDPGPGGPSVPGDERPWYARQSIARSLIWAAL